MNREPPVPLCRWFEHRCSADDHGGLLLVFMQRMARRFSDDPGFMIFATVVRLLVRCFVGHPKQLEPAYEDEGIWTSLDVLQKGRIIRSEMERKRLQQYQKPMKTNHSNRFETYSYVFVFPTEEVQFSFLGQIITLLVDFTFGVDQTFIIRDDRIVFGGSQVVRTRSDLANPCPYYF